MFLSEKRSYLFGKTIISKDFLKFHPCIWVIVKHRRENGMDFFREKVGFFDFDVLKGKLFAFVQLENVIVFEFMD